MYGCINKVTVIIPLYNKKMHIQRALISVLNQTHDNFEVIVVNDGSTDGSEKVVEQYADQRIQLISQDNSGVSAARNRGINEAKTELIAFLDADDEWMPDYLETVIALRNRFPEAVIWATGFNTIRPNGETMKPPISYSIIAGSDDQYLINIFKSPQYFSNVWTSSIMASKTAIQNVGGFPEYYRISEDTYLWNRLAFCNPIAYCPLIKAIYHMDADNHAFANSEVFFEGVHPVIAAYFDHASTKDLAFPISNGIYRHIAKYIIMSLGCNAVCKAKIAIADIFRICMRIKALIVLAPICSFAYLISGLPKPLILILYNGYRLLCFKKPRIPECKSRYTNSGEGLSIFLLSNH